MKKIWKYLFLIVVAFCLQNEISTAQINLIQNGSFEQYYSCPTSTSQVDSCIGWYKVINTPYDYCSPDYFDTCAPYPVSVPDNLCGSQLPFEGHAYTGLYTFHWAYFYREVIMTQLLYPLIPGNTYHISIRVSRGNWTVMAQNQTASNKIGLRFTTFAYTNTDTPAINNIAQVYSDSIIKDTLNWILLNWDYVPDSAYTHVYIGNFFDDLNTDTNNIGWNFGQAYYFIDSINVICVSSNCVSGINSSNDAGLNIIYHSGKIFMKDVIDNKTSILIYNGTGQLILNRKVNSNEIVNISEFTDGFYLAVLKSRKKSTYKKIIKY